LDRKEGSHKTNREKKKDPSQNRFGKDDVNSSAISGNVTSASPPYFWIFSFYFTYYRERSSRHLQNLDALVEVVFA